MTEYLLAITSILALVGCIIAAIALRECLRLQRDISEALGTNLALRVRMAELEQELSRMDQP